MPLYNSLDSKILKANLMAELFARKTISLYRYFILDNPQEFRDQLYRECRDLKNGSETEKQRIKLNNNFKFGNSKVYRKSFRLAENSNFADPDSVTGPKPTV